MGQDSGVLALTKPSGRSELEPWSLARKLSGGETVIRNAIAEFYPDQLEPCLLQESSWGTGNGRTWPEGVYFKLVARPDKLLHRYLRSASFSKS